MAERTTGRVAKVAGRPGGRARGSRRRRCVPPVLALAAALAAAPVAAQSFTGRVVDETTGRGVPTAGVYLIDAAGAAVGSAIADAAGRYRLEIPSDGDYRLLVERFGYTDTESPLFAVTADRDYPVELSIRPEPIQVEGLSVRVRNERVEDWLTLAIGMSPYAVPGFRHIQGLRLREAIEKSDDGIDVLRWLYLPAFNRTGRFCVSPYTGQGCLNVYLDGRYMPAEHLETIDYRELVNVIVLPPALHLLTRRHTFDPFHANPYAGMEYTSGDTIR